MKMSIFVAETRIASKSEIFTKTWLSILVEWKIVAYFINLQARLFRKLQLQKKTVCNNLR